MDIEDLVCPAGTSGLAVAPWAADEIYAVAANWAQAGAPVWTYGATGWDLECHGRQVADFRHEPRAALASELYESLIASGESEDEARRLAEELADDATEVG